MSTGNSYISKVIREQATLGNNAVYCYETRKAAKSSDEKLKATKDFWRIFNKYALSGVTIKSVAANRFLQEKTEDKADNFAKWVVSMVDANPKKAEVEARWEDSDVLKVIRAIDENEYWLFL